MRTTCVQTRARTGPAIIAVVLALGATPALAQNDDDGSPDDGNGVIAPGARARHAEGEYGGVGPDGAAPEGGMPARHKRHLGKPVITWIGFQARDNGASRLFVQLLGDVDHDVRVDGQRAILTLADARFGDRNASRFIDTRYFETSVRKVTPRRVRKRRAQRDQPAQAAGVQLAIEFKNPLDTSAPAVQQSRGQDGYYYLYLDFGPATPLPDEQGSATTEAEAADTAAP